MPFFDIIKNGTVEEVFARSRSELAALGVTIAPSRIHVGGRPTEEPFASKVLRGYRKAEERSSPYVWKAKTIKNTWSH